jgi:hypothetical protein
VLTNKVHSNWSPFYRSKEETCIGIEENDNTSGPGRPRYVCVKYTGENPKPGNRHRVIRMPGHRN